MPNKNPEAVLIGILLWAAGLLLTLVFGQEPYFLPFAVFLAFLLAPAMYLITKWHLRNVPSDEKENTAMRLGILAAAVQFPLDAIGLLSMFRFGVPPLAPEAREALIIVLEIGYLLILLVPWLAGKQKQA